MCVIVLARDKKPTLDILTRCDRENPHGAGIAWFNDKNKAAYKKGIMTAKEVHDFIQFLPLPFVIHFRTSSAGLSHDKMLSHPFEITRDSNLKLSGECNKLLMHNGTITNWEFLGTIANIDYKSRGLMSDSRLMAMIAAKINDELFLKKIDSRFVVINAVRQKFVMYGNFQFEDGIYYSNLTWKYSQKGCHINCNTNDGWERDPNTGAWHKTYDSKQSEKEDWGAHKSGKLSRKERKRLKKLGALIGDGLNDSEFQTGDDETDLAAPMVKVTDSARPLEITDKELEDMNREWMTKNTHINNFANEGNPNEREEVPIRIHEQKPLNPLEDKANWCDTVKKVLKGVSSKI